MEAIYQRLIDGAARVTVAGNGGLFTIIEANAALKNGVPIVLIEDSGRFADLATAIKRYFSAESLLHTPSARETLDRNILELIANHVPTEHQERIYKDFGKQIPAEKPEQELYRQYLYDFMRLSANQKVVISSIDELDLSVEKLLMKS